MLIINVADDDIEANENGKEKTETLFSLLRNEFKWQK